MASSHSDAPLIKQDPQANLTDVYAFVGTLYNDPSKKVLNVVVNVHPFSEPGDGVMYERFADDALFSINIANPNTGALIESYNFRFSPVSSKEGTYKNLEHNSFLRTRHNHWPDHERERFSAELHAVVHGHQVRGLRSPNELG